MPGLSRPAVMRAVKELEQGGHLTVTRLKIGKKNASNRYRLPAMTGSSETPPSVCETPPPSVCEIPEPGSTLEPVKKAAAAISESNTGQAEDSSIDPPSTQPAEVTSIGVTSKPAVDRSIDLSTKPTRHTCSCGNSWPVSCGPRCHRCVRKPSTAGMAAPTPGKYDDLEGDAPPRPRKGALQAEYVARLKIARKDKQASRRQYQRADGSFSELPGGC